MAEWLAAMGMEPKGDYLIERSNSQYSNNVSIHGLFVVSRLHLDLRLSLYPGAKSPHIILRGTGTLAGPVLRDF